MSRQENKNSKSQLIRDYVAQHPQAAGHQVVKAMKKRGLTSSHVYTVLSKLKKQRAAIVNQTPGILPSPTTPAAGPQDASLTHNERKLLLGATKDFVETICGGDLNRAHEALELYEVTH